MVFLVGAVGWLLLAGRVPGPAAPPPPDGATAQADRVINPAPPEQLRESVRVLDGAAGGGAGRDVRDEPPLPPGELVNVGQAPPPRPTASSGPARVVTDGAGLLLRSGPGRDTPLVGKMLEGDVVDVLDCEPGRPGTRWCAVVYGEVGGWALDEFLDIGGPAYDSESGLERAFRQATPIERTASIDRSKVDAINLRETPRADGSLLTQLAPGVGLYVHRCLPVGWSLGGRAIRGRWCFATAHDGRRSISGWVSDGALFL